MLCKRASSILPLVLVLGCNKAQSEPMTSPPADVDASASAQPEGEGGAWPAVPTDLPQHEIAEGESLMINTGVCASGRWSGALPFGSVWIVVAAEGDECVVWLGGETENPNYEGETTGLCRVPREGGPALEIVVGDGGPAWIEHPACSRE